MSDFKTGIRSLISLVSLDILTAKSQVLIQVELERRYEISHFSKKKLIQTLIDFAK
jgi:hypothetical protein